MADSYLDTAGGMQQVPTVNVIEKTEQPYVATDGSMQSAVAVNELSGGVPADGVALTDGETVDILSSDGGTQLAQGTADIDTSTNPHTLKGIELPPSTTTVEEGDSIPLKKADGSSYVHVGTGKVEVSGHTLAGVEIPADATLIAENVEIDILDYGSGGGQVAGLGRVTNNEGSVQLANATTKIAINAAPVQVTAGSKTVGATIAVDQGNWQAFPLTNSTDAIVSDGDTIEVFDGGGGAVNVPIDVASGAISGAALPNDHTIVIDQAAFQVPVTGTYTDTVTITVAVGAITGIVLS